MATPISKASRAQCASEWQGRVARHAVSGQTVAVFCTAIGSPTSLDIMGIMSSISSDKGKENGKERAAEDATGL
jgi:hypothetical protein